MNEFGSMRIVFSERLATGIIVHFEDNVSVFFPAEFLYEQRGAQSNTVFTADEEPELPPALKSDEWRKSAGRAGG